MKIRITGEAGAMTVERYIERCTDSRDYGAGALELAAQKADETSLALGRLCGILLDRGVLRLDDIHAIGRDYRDIEGVIE